MTRPCGCAADPAVFGHTACPAGPPVMVREFADERSLAERVQRDRWTRQQYLATRWLAFPATGETR